MHELYVLIDGQGRVRVDDEVLTLRPLDALLVEPEHVRQLFNDTDSDALWLVVGAPRDGRRGVGDRSGSGLEPDDDVGEAVVVEEGKLLVLWRGSAGLGAFAGFVAGLFGVLSVANVRDASADGPPPLPPEAYSACESKRAGDACVARIHDRELQGVCSAHPSDGRLFCRPEGPPTPPPQAFAAGANLEKRKADLI